MGCRNFDAVVHRYTLKISNLFFSPKLNHLSRVALAMPVSKSELTTDVPLPVLENKDRSFEHLYCVFFNRYRPILIWWEWLSFSNIHRANCQVNVGFLTSADTSLKLVNFFVCQHLVYLFHSSRVKTVFNGCPISLILHSYSILINSIFRAFETIVNRISKADIRVLRVENRFVGFVSLETY